MSGIAKSSFSFAESKAKAVHIEENRHVDLCLYNKLVLKSFLCLVF